MFVKGCNFYIVGICGFYVVFLLMLWFFSFIVVFCGCILFVLVMYNFDVFGFDSDDDFI